jgi:hypothetical protein
MSGQIVDASLIAAPRPRNTQDEKKAIKDGRIPDAWKDKPAKLRQKDRDARWTVKYTKAKPREVDRCRRRSGDSGLRLSDHISLDRGFGFIRKGSATDAAAFEGRRLTRWTSRQDQHGEQRLGGHRLPIGRQRGVHGKERLRHIDSMKPRFRTPSSIGSNQSSRSMMSAATAAVRVVDVVMTTPTQFQPLPRQHPLVHFASAIYTSC